MKEKISTSKIKNLLLGVLLTLVFLLPCFSVKSSVFATTNNTIDVYLIAGQSNAAGYSNKGSLNGTFNNVGYAGEVDKQLNQANSGVSNIANYSNYLWQISAGLGRTSNHIGPEYGIAKKLNASYTGNTKAFIFKTAAGGTALRDLSTSGSGTYGNWYPRSKWVSGYTPNPNSNDPTGVMYYNFVENFKTVYQNLLDNGYTPIVKGMAWMQGEDDLGADSEYKNLLKAFISDIRNDLVEITGDTDLRTMPFVIGKIATSFGQSNHPYVPSFNIIQQEVANEMDGVETIETSDLIIVNQNGSINGTDMYHFNTADAVTLGERFGDKLIEMNGNYVFFNANNATCSYQESTNGSIDIYVNAKSGYKVTKLIVNGEDVTSQLQNGKYTIVSPTKVTDVIVETKNLSTCTITYENFENGNFLYWYDNVEKQIGETLKVKIRANSGYEIEAVYCNGEEMIYNADLGVYETVVEKDSLITAKTKVATEKPPILDDETDNSSCSSAISVISEITAFGFCAFAVLLLRNKKKI